jgi:ADP-ribose pyrophosphatase YjhB (NUDIX family)/catechol 2,3-dioxygenase-like lactoylglutathione lyase family enzyme
MIEAIHHVQLTVPTASLEDAMHFYRDVLGLPLAPRPDDLGRHGYWFRVFDRDLHLGVEENVDRHATRAHVAFKVTDVPAMKAKLEAAGIKTSVPAGMAGYERLHFRDPFGNMVELLRASKNFVEVDRAPQPKVHLSVAVVHEGKLLMVREGKPAMRDKWNLPGGHAERGEFAVAGAMRELVEETGVEGVATGVLGLFSTAYSIRLVILARADDPKPLAGDEVLESRFWEVSELQKLGGENFINPVMMAAILRRAAAGTSYALEVVEDIKG